MWHLGSLYQWRGLSLLDYKAVYTTASIAYRWAGAVTQVKPSFGVFSHCMTDQRMDWEWVTEFVHATKNRKSWDYDEVYFFFQDFLYLLGSIREYATLSLSLLGKAKWLFLHALPARANVLLLLASPWPISRKHFSRIRKLFCSSWFHPGPDLHVAGPKDDP